MARETKTWNPFLDEDDDVDDDEFLNHPQQGRSGYMLDNSQKRNEWEIKRMQLLEERRQIEERTLQSTYNSVGLIHESEQVGILTAEELSRQREKLQNIEGNLDTINNTMRTSQKHINSMKSMFGSIKNLFSKGTTSDTAVTHPEPLSTRKPSGILLDAVRDLKTEAKLNEAKHPALGIKDLSFDDLDSPGIANQPTKLRSPPASTRFSNNTEEKIEQNLDQLSMGLGRLKLLATGLYDEIESQNEMIDTIHDKADKADETLGYQNRQIDRILKK